MSSPFIGPAWRITQLAMPSRSRLQIGYAARRFLRRCGISEHRAAAALLLVVCCPYPATHFPCCKLTFLSIAVMGNTTCPASDLHMTSLHMKARRFLPEQYGTSILPFQLCPLPLFVDIITTNHLRMQAARVGAAVDIEALQGEAHNLLDRIDSFSPHQLAESKYSSREDWVLVGKVYQAAVALYCILSLQSLSVLPETPELRIKCATNGTMLQTLLEEALASKKLNRFIVWPLVLLGVEAAYGGASMRAFVANQLSELSRDVGSYVPLMAKRVLEGFWASGETRWDACFCRPYIFTMQIAVDTSRLMPLYK